MEPEKIASVCHEANRALQNAYGELASPPWDLASREMKASAVDGVHNALAGASPQESHRNWLEFKMRHGWTYGEVKNEEAKTHPCMVSYEELPEEQRVKDYLFTVIVNTLRDAP